MLRSVIPAILFIASGSLAHADANTADAVPRGDPARGELLYSTHCIACHGARMHWRDKKRATDWQSLQSEIQRWQGVSGLGWSREDIADVARYLNTLYYHYPAPD